MPSTSSPHRINIISLCACLQLFDFKGKTLQKSRTGLYFKIHFYGSIFFVCNAQNAHQVSFPNPVLYSQTLSYLVCQEGCHYKISQTGRLKLQKCISRNPGSWKSKFMVPTGLVSPEGRKERVCSRPFLSCRWPPSCCLFTWSPLCAFTPLLLLFVLKFPLLTRAPVRSDQGPP